MLDLEEMAAVGREGLREVVLGETGIHTYLVSLVIVLRIILKHLRAFLVVESPHQVVGTEGLAPGLVIHEPIVEIHTSRQYRYLRLLHRKSLNIASPSLFPQIFGKIHVHLLRQLHIKLPRPQEPQHRQRVQSLLAARLLQHRPQLVYLRILFLGRVARVTALRLRGGGRVVVVVVFRVEIHVGVFFGDRFSRLFARGAGGGFM